MARHRLLLTLAAVLVVALGVGAPIWAHAHPRHVDRCPFFRAEARQRAQLVTGSGAPVLVIGDSYSAGHLIDPAQSWPTRLPGKVYVDAFSGSGFSRDASPCGDVSYATRARQALATGHPAYHLVVVEGGLNDYDQPDAAIESGFHRLLQVLTGQRVVVVGPPPAPSRARAAAHVDALLSGLAATAGVDYVSMIHAELPYLSDRLHLTPAGHREFGDLVAAALDDQPVTAG